MPANPDLESLLTPTLATSAQRAIYSVKANFFVAFFGGSMASILFVAGNVRKLGRLKEDGWFLIAAAAVALGFAFWMGYVTAVDQVPDLLAAMGDDSRGLGYASRLLALTLFGCAYLLHRRFYLAMKLSGLDPPNPWKMGIGCVVVGGLLQYGAVMLGTTWANG